MNTLCPNTGCMAHRKKIKSVRYKSKKSGTFYCNVCKKSWNESRGTFLYNIKTPIPVVLKSIYKVFKGKSLRQVAKEERVSVDSIYSWLGRAQRFPKSIAELLHKYMDIGSEELSQFIAGLRK